MMELLSDREKRASMKEMFYESFSEKKFEKISKDISELLDIIIEEVNSKSGDMR